MAEKPTRRDWKHVLDVNAPEGMDRSKLPSFMTAEEYKKSGKKRGSPELDMQTECYQWSLTQPHLLTWATPNHLLFRHKPSGAELHWMEKQKEAGLCKGACDLNNLFRNIHGASVLAVIELKIGYAKPDEDQMGFMDRANALGAYSGVAYTFQQYKDHLEAAGFVALLKAAGHPNA